MVHSGRHRLGGQRYDVEQRRVDRIGEPVKTSPHVLTVQGLKTQLPEIRDLPRIHQVQHRGIVVCDPIGGLVHLQLGRAYALAGDRVKAKSAYEDFLTLWKDADPDIPIYKQAKAEYAKLQ